MTIKAAMYTSGRSSGDLYEKMTNRVKGMSNRRKAIKAAVTEYPLEYRA